MDGTVPSFDWLLAIVKASFFHARPEGWFVIGVFIIPVTVLAIMNIILVWHRLKLEWSLLQSCREFISQIGNGQIEQSNIDQWLNGSPSDSVVAKLVRTIWASRRLANPDLEATFTMLSQSEAARLGFARSAPNILLLAGLFGTVLGLAGAVGSLGPQIQITLQTPDPVVLTQKLGETLKHMQTAFACTLWGIFCAIFVATATRRVTGQQSELLAQVQEFGMREFAQKVLPQAQAVQLEDIRQILQESQQFLENIRVIMTNAAKDFKQILEGAGNTMKESLQQLLQVADDVHRAANALESSAQKVQQSTEALREYHSDLRNAYIELRNLFDESQEKLERQVSAQLQRIGELQKQFEQASLAIVGRIDQASQNLSKATQAFDQAGNKFVQSGIEVQQTLGQGFQWLAETIHETLKDHRREMTRVEEHLRELMSRLSELMERLDPRLLPREEWEAVKESLNSCVSALWRYNKTIEELLTQILAGVGPVNRDDGIDSELQKILTQILQVVKNLDQTFKGVQSSIQGLTQIVNSSPQNFPPTDNAELLQAIRSLSESIGALKEILQRILSISHLREKQGFLGKLFGRFFG